MEAKGQREGVVYLEKFTSRKVKGTEPPERCVTRTLRRRLLGGVPARGGTDASLPGADHLTYERVLPSSNS